MQKSQVKILNNWGGHFHDINLRNNGAIVILWFSIICGKVIREKSRGEGSLIVQDTIENVSEPKFFV